MEQKDKIVRGIVYSTFALSLLLVICYILNFTELYFNSDAAATVLLAKEQLAKKQLLPEGFCYSTAVFVISLSTFIAPLMPFISDWMLCRKIAVIVLTMIFFVLIFLFYKKIGINKKRGYAPFLAIVLFCLPMGHYRQTFYEAGYVLPMVAELLILLLLFKIIGDKKSTKREIFCFVLLFAAGVLWNSGDIRNQVIIMLPAILSVILYLVFEYLITNENLLSKRIICALSTIAVAACTGFLNYSYLSQRVGLNSTTAQIVFSTNINENLYKIPELILSFYGAVNSCELLSLQGILGCVNFVLFAIATFIVPVLSITLYKKIENKFLKIYIIYIWISNFIVVFMMLFTNMTNVGQGYYQTVFFHNLMLTALLIEYLLTHKVAVIKYTFVIAVLGTVFLSHFVYVRDNSNARYIYEEKNEYSLVQFLKDNNLTYGYATFWNAYNHMVLSNGEITVAGVLPGGNNPYYWLTSRDWYDIDLYNGRSFYLLAEGETLDTRFFEEASDIKYFNGYTILIFEKNVLEYRFEDNSGKLRTLSMGDLVVGNNAYRDSDRIILKKKGSYGSSPTQLDAGIYEIKMTGTNINCIAPNSDEELNVIKQTNKELVLSFALPEYSEVVEIINVNESEEIVLVDSVELIEKKEND